MSLFDTILAPGYNDGLYDQDNGDTSALDRLEYNSTQHVAERGTFMDIMHDLALGSSEALKVMGSGMGLESVERLGENLGKTELVKPDTSQYYGTQDRVGRVVDMVMQSLPLTVGIGGTIAGGTAVAGPAGTIATATGAFGALGKGIFNQSAEELRAARPDATDEEVLNYSLINAVSEVGSEGLGLLLPFGLGKLVGKTASKATLTTLLDTGRLTSSEAIASIVKKVGAKESVGAMFGGAVADGASEVVNELVQAANRESAGLDAQPVDLIDIFLAGSAPGGAITAGTMMMDSRVKSKVKSKLEAGLQSEDLTVRQDTVETMGLAMDNIATDLGSAFRSKMGSLVEKGPVSLDAAIAEESTKESLSTSIINRPEEVLKKEGIPSSSITTVDMGGTPVETPMDKMQKESLRYNREKNTAAPVKTVDPTNTLIDQEMAKVYADTNDLKVVHTPEEIAKVQNFMDVSRDSGHTIEDYRRAMDDEAVKSSILMGMDQVEKDSNELKNPQLTLVERRQLKNSIRTNKELIAEEITDAKGKTAGLQGNAKEVSAVAGEGVQLPKEKATGVGQKKKKVQKEASVVTTAPAATQEKLESTPISPIAAQETAETTVVPKTPKQSVAVPKKAPEQKITEGTTEKTTDTEATVEEADVPLTAAQSELAIAWMDKVSAEDSMLLAKRGAPVTDDVIEVEEYSEDVQSDKGTKREYTGSRFTDGSTIERGTKTKDKLFKVTIRGQVFRSSSRTKATEAIQGKRKLEPWEDKDKTTILTKERKKLTDKQKSNMMDFFRKQGAAAVLARHKELKLEGEPKELTEAEAYKEAYAHVTKGMKLADMEGIYNLAVGDVASKEVRVTPGAVRTRMNQLAKAEQNTSDATKKAKAGLSVASVSADELFAKEEAAANREDTAETMGLEEEDLGDAIDTEDKSSGKMVAYTQEGKQRYTLKKQWYKTDGTKVSADKKGPDATMRLETSDGRYEVAEAPRENGQVRFFLLKDGTSAGITFSNPTEAMEFAKATDEVQMEAGSGTRGTATGTARFPDGLSLLENVAQSGDPISSALAKMLLANVDPKKLKDITVSIGSMNAHKNGHIVLQKDATPISQLHEIVHGITVREMASNNKLFDEVTRLREAFKKKMVSEAYITPAIAKQMDAMQFSQEFESAKKEGVLDFGMYKDTANGPKLDLGYKKRQDVAYATLNNNEFLAMAYANKHVQELMKGIEGKERSLWEKLKGFVAKALGLSTDSKNMSMLEEVLSLSVEIAQEKRVTGKGGTEMSLETGSTSMYVPTDRMVQEILKSRRGKSVWKETVLTQGQSVKNFAEYIARPMSDILRTVSERLYGSLMNFESKLILDQTRYSHEIRPFLTWYKNLSDSQKLRYDSALMNSQHPDNQKIISEIPKNVYASLDKVLSDLKGRMDAVGLGGTSKDFYFPRRVKDVPGLINHLMKDKDYKGQFGKAFEEEALRLGVPELSAEQRAQVITDQFQSGHFRQLPRPGASKERTIPFVTPETYEFYSNSSDAIIGHIFEMNEKIGQREFIGGSTRKKDIQKLEKEFRDIEKMEDGPERDKKILEYQQAADALDNIEQDLQNRLGALVAEELKDAPMEDQKKVTDLINSRLRQRGASGVIDLARNLGYATTMGNFMSAITQLGDIPILFYRFGLHGSTIKAVQKAFSNVASIVRNEISGKEGTSDAIVEAADFTNMLREFTQASKSGAIVEKLFKLSGLKYADLIGKEAFMQAAWAHYKNPKNKTEFTKRYEPFFGKDTERVYQEMQGTKKTNDVMTVLIGELSDFQPVSLSQQSQGYLGAGNMRVFYMLKTFTLRATSAALREGAAEMSKGNYMKGAIKTASIILLYSAAGAGAGELKDLLKGRDEDIEDKVFDNILQMLFMSRYSLDKGVQTDSVLKTLMSDIFPPVRYADSFIADTYALFSEEKELKFKSLSSVPLIGTIAYARSAAGQSTYAAMEKKDIMEAIADNKSSGKGPYAGGVSEMIRKYNAGVSRDEKITNDKVMRKYRGQ